MLGTSPVPGAPQSFTCITGRSPQVTPRWALSEETEAGKLEAMCKVARQEAAHNSGLGAWPCLPAPPHSPKPRGRKGEEGELLRSP